MENSPWPAEQKVYILTLSDPSANTPRMYTLRTRLHQEAATNRLKRVRSTMPPFAVPDEVDTIL